MKDHDKSQTVHIPSQSTGADQRRGANLDDIDTQLIMDKSGSEVGRLTIVEGPGTGNVRSVFSGTNQVGRYPENKIALDFGDNAISRHQHAVITYSRGDRIFRILDGGKPNPVLVNGAKVVSDQELKNGDLLRIGMTTLRFNVL